MEKVAYHELKQDDNFLDLLQHNIWLMDNHKWALYAWEVSRRNIGVEKLTLVHADYHWDGVDIFLESPELIPRLLEADPRQLHYMTEHEEGIKCDSFIAPAVRRQMFDEIHFYCRQDDGDRGIGREILAKAKAKQFFHKKLNSLCKRQFPSPLIFDFCLDLFNKSKEYAVGDLWSDAEVLDFLDAIKSLVQKAAIVTVSMSFDYSGDADDTRHLTELILPRLLEWRTH